MGKFIATDPETTRRARRIGLFCREIKRAMMNRCLDHNLPTRELDFFIEELYQSMDFQGDEFTLERLLGILLEGDFVDEAFARYSKRP